MKQALTVIFLLFILCTDAQHASTYSQFMFNGLLLNPAYAGTHDALNLTALYRKQWLGMEGTPTTMNFSAHLPLKKRKAGLGLILMNDHFGVSDQTRASFMYSYRIRTGRRGQLSFGLLGGIGVYQNNWGQIKTTQSSDPSFAVNTERKIAPHAGFGIYYYSPKFYLGISAPSVPVLSFHNYQTVLFNTGCVLDVSENFKIKPAVLVKYILHSPIDLNGSTTFYWKDAIGIGLGYSTHKTGFAYADIKVNYQFRVGYAYDYSFLSLRNYSSGSHEIMLRYLFQYKIQVPSIRYF